MCNFNQTNIRKTSRKLALRTDASARFENGISPDKVGEAMDRMTKMIVEIAGGEASEDILDIYPRKANLYKVGISTQEVNRLLGLDFSDKDIEEILNKLNFKYEKIKPLDKVLELTEKFIGAPYKSGASVTYDAPNEFDCSSFTSYLFAQAGIAIPRISVDQYLFGKNISELDLQAGDLVFANTGLVVKTGIHTKTVEFLPGTEIPEGVDHVGLYLGDGKIVHTSSKEIGLVIENLKEAKMFQNIVGYRRVVENKDQERYVITVPHERLDLRIKEDLIEEVGRVYGYKNIKSVPLDSNLVDRQGKIFEPKINKSFYYLNKIRNILTEAGFSEVYTYTFGDKGNVEVQKPLASNLGFLRTNLSDGVRKSLELNIKNAPVLGLDEIKIFEIGKVFESLDDENTSLAIGVEIAKKMKQSKAISMKQEIIQNVIGLLEKELNIKIENDVIDGIVEIDFDKLVDKLPEPESYGNVLKLDSEEVVIFKKVSQYPFMLRDIAVFVPNENNDKDVLEVIKQNAGDLLIRTKLFDIYAPEGEDKTSYAFNLVFQSQEKTLTDEEINIVMDKITNKIEEIGWEVR